MAGEGKQKMLFHLDFHFSYNFSVTSKVCADMELKPSQTRDLAASLRPQRACSRSLTVFHSVTELSMF